MIFTRAIRGLTRHRVRTALTLLGVAVSSALLLDMVLLSGGIERSFSRLLLSRGFQVRASPQGTLPFDADATFGNATALLASLGNEPGVAAVGGVLGTTAFVDRGALVAVVVYGVTPEVQGSYRLLRGADLATGDTSGVLLGEPAARRLGVAIGDTIRLAGRLDPSAAAVRVRRTGVVRGIVTFVYDARDQPSIAVPLAVAQELAGPAASDRASMLMIRVREDTSVDKVTAALRHHHPEVSFNSIGDMISEVRLRLSYFRQLSLILGSISLIVTVLLVGTLLAIGVNERIGEIAAMRAIGVSRSSIVREVVTQGLVLTVVGGVIGTLLGIVTARWLDTILTSFPGLPAAISFFVADTRQLVAATITLVLTGLVAASVPAWSAAATPIAMTLRSDAP